ncbi:MAG: zf-HC2 domain-containing protein [Chloroflexia bacterium]|nr:zf-HC2 domain-containing protein [Chloroflexia bacterium]
MDSSRTVAPGDLTCREFVELVTDYLENALDQPTRARFEDHLIDCPDCPVYLRQMEEIVGAAGFLREEDVSPEVREVLLSRFRTWRIGG